MGWRFSLDHANIVAYLTSATARAPRMPRHTLRFFINSLSQDEAFAKRSERPWMGAFLSDDSSWAARVNDLAHKATDVLDRSGYDDWEVLAPDTVDMVLRDLRIQFSRYRLFALMVDDGKVSEASTKGYVHAARLAYDSGRDALVLFPSDHLHEVEILDPFPAFSLAIQSMHHWPGVLFWSPFGTAAFVNVDALPKFVDEMLSALQNVGEGGVEHILRSQRPDSPPKQILHLSDLHFGSSHATRNRGMLEAKLSSVASMADRVVITGDLFDNPTDDALQQFESFRLSIHRATAKEPLLVAGNHDQRIAGNIGQFSRQVAQLNWCSVVADDDLGIVFAGFNSAEAGSFARGRIKMEQFVRVGGQMQNAISVDPQRERYLKVVLVHHHPFGFRTEHATWIQRALSWLGMNDETFLEMENAGEFLEWCAQWGVPIVLHGHKHVPRYFEKYVSPQNGRGLRITAVGCGSSLGAEGSPLCYTMVQWDARRRRWCAAFFESRGGGPFVQSLVTISEPADH